MIGVDTSNSRSIWRLVEDHYIEVSAAPPNKALQLTIDPADLFAAAKSTSASIAAELGR